MASTMTRTNVDAPLVTASRRLVAFPSILAISALLGIAFAAVVKPGVPYDEPAHWLNVLYFAAHHRLPVIGDPSVSYEAQQPPLSYWIASLVEEPVRMVASTTGGFYATRIVGGIEWLIALVFAWRILGRLLPEGSAGRPVAFAVLALNPMLLAMAWSVQNDSLALLLGFAAIDYSSMVGRRSFDGFHGAVLGAIVAAGVLTKLTAWALVPAILMWLILVPRAQRRWRAAVAFALAVAALSGWWFVRNIVLYGDPGGKGKAAAESSGFGPLRFTGIGSLGHLVENVITYLWLPTEYWRGIIHASGAVKGLIVVMTLAVLVLSAIAGVRHVRLGRQGPSDGLVAYFAGIGPRPDTWLLVIITAVIASVAWVYLAFTWSALAPRLAYAILPLWMGLVGLGANAIGQAVPRVRHALAVATGVVMLGLCAWSLHAIHAVGAPWPFVIHL